MPVYELQASRWIVIAYFNASSTGVEHGGGCKRSGQPLPVVETVVVKGIFGRGRLLLTLTAWAGTVVSVCIVLVELTGWDVVVFNSSIKYVSVHTTHRQTSGRA